MVKKAQKEHYNYILYIKHRESTASTYYIYVKLKDV